MTNKEELESLRALLEKETPVQTPNKVEYFSPHYEFVVQIGPNHTASVIIDEESYYELMENAELE